jgi:hypothetical protein
MKGFIEKVATSRPYREQHYNFVHNHLQIISFTRPEMLRAKLASWGARRYLIRLWNKCGSLETGEPIPAGSLSCCIKKDGRAGVLAIITLLNHGILKELSMEAFVEQVKILAKTGWRDSRIQAGD